MGNGVSEFLTRQVISQELERRRLLPHEERAGVATTGEHDHGSGRERAVEFVQLVLSGKHTVRYELERSDAQDDRGATEPVGKHPPAAEPGSGPVARFCHIVFGSTPYERTADEARD